MTHCLEMLGCRSVTRWQQGLRLFLFSVGGENGTRRTCNLRAPPLINANPPENEGMSSEKGPFQKKRYSSNHPFFTSYISLREVDAQKIFQLLFLVN